LATDKAQRILDNIREAFALITAAGGYNNTVGYKNLGVKPYTEIPEDQFPALMVAGADENRENGTNQTFTSVMDISIVGYIRSSDIQDHAVALRELMDLIADLTKALYVDHTRGGLCKFTEVGKVMTDKGVMFPYAAFEMVVQVDYRSEFTTP
jgi:hypothetical protein